ncbi:hypothetical protein E4T56_gene13015 [Termitomyces sp. T112]|nr:hypothetical protein E4T56_gene13015 [Termitomyces sp. T112]
MPRVLVSGVNGFIGSNVTAELLKAGYQVRGTLRGAKIESCKAAISHKFPHLEVVQVDDIATADLTDVLGALPNAPPNSPNPHPPSTPTLGNSNASLANPNGPQTNSDTFSTAINTSSELLEPSLPFLTSLYASNSLP